MKRKYDYLKVVQGHTNYGWEDLCCSLSLKEARIDLKAYRENAAGAYRIITRRVLRED